jgi:hypothetical protein
MFLSQLRNDLAKSIPVDINRLDNIQYYKHDESQQPSKILLTLPIKSTKNLNERDVDRMNHKRFGYFDQRKRHYPNFMV